MYPSSSAFSPDDYVPIMVPNGNPPMQPLGYPLQHPQYPVDQKELGMMYANDELVTCNSVDHQNIQNVPDLATHAPVNKQELEMMFQQAKHDPFNPALQKMPNDCGMHDSVNRRGFGVMHDNQQNQQAYLLKSSLSDSQFMPNDCGLGDPVIQNSIGMNWPVNQGYAYDTLPFSYDRVATMPSAIPNSMDSSTAVPYLNHPVNTPKFGDFSGVQQERISGKMKKKTEKKISTMHLNTSCSHCGTRETTQWRTNDKGELECNACNQYFRTNGVARPQNLWNKPTATRRRRPTAPVADKNQG